MKAATNSGPLGEKQKGVKRSATKRGMCLVSGLEITQLAGSKRHKQDVKDKKRKRGERVKDTGNTGH